MILRALTVKKKQFTCDLYMKSKVELDRTFTRMMTLRAFVKARKVIINLVFLL
jgi:hypothetical protein